MSSCFFNENKIPESLKNSFISDFEFLLIQSGLDSLDDRKLVDLFIHALQPSIKEAVVLKQPKNLQEASEIARLKECAISSSSSSLVPKEQVAKTISTLSDTSKETEELRTKMDQILEHLTFSKRTITKTNKKWCWFHKSSIHSASDCRTLKKRQQPKRYPSSKNTIRLNTTHDSVPSPFNPMTTTVMVTGQKTQAVMDTRSAVTVLSDKQYERLPNKPTLSLWFGPAIGAANDTLLDVVGATEVFITVGNSCVKVSCIVVRSFPYSLLLGNDTLHKFGATISFGNQQILVGNTSVSVSILKASSKPNSFITSTVLKILPYLLVR
jgi:hypothetical protein